MKNKSLLSTRYSLLYVVLSSSWILVGCHNGSQNQSAGGASTNAVEQQKLWASQVTDEDIKAMFLENKSDLSNSQRQALFSKNLANSPEQHLKSVQGGMLQVGVWPGLLGAAVFYPSNSGKFGWLIGGGYTMPKTFLDPNKFDIKTENMEGGIDLKVTSTRDFESEMFGVDAGASVSAYGAYASAQVSYLTQSQSTDTSMSITMYARQYSQTSISPKNSPTYADDPYNGYVSSAVGNLVSVSKICNDPTVMEQFTNEDTGIKTCEWIGSPDYDVVPARAVVSIWDKMGNGFISNVKTGLLFTATIQLQFSDKKSSDSFKSKFNAGYKGAGGTAADVWAAINSASQETHSSFSLKVSTYQWGGAPFLAAHVLDHVSECSVGSDGQLNIAKCSQITNDLVNYVKDNSSYGLAYQYNHPELYPRYVFAGVSSKDVYLFDGSLNLRSKMSSTGVVADIGSILQGQIFDGNKASSYSSIDDVVERVASYAVATLGGSDQVQAYENNNEVQQRLWGSVDKFNQDLSKAKNISTFINYKGNGASYLYVLGDKNGTNYTFISGLLDALRFPSSYTLSTRNLGRQDKIDILLESEVIAYNAQNINKFESGVTNYIDKYSYQLGHGDEMYNRRVSNWYLLPAEKGFENNLELRHYILASTTSEYEYDNIPPTTIIHPDKFGSTDIYLRDTKIGDKSGLELFGVILGAEDHSTIYRPFGLNGIESGTHGGGTSSNKDKEITWNNSICSTWSTNPIYIIPGSRIDFDVQSSRLDPDEPHKEGTYGPKYSAIAPNMFPLCSGGFDKEDADGKLADVKCGNSAFFAYYSNSDLGINSTHPNDACMRLLIKVQDLFRTIEPTATAQRIHAQESPKV